MNTLMRRASTLAAGLLAMGLACVALAADQSKTVGGVVINLGIVPAEVALRAEGHSEAHPKNPPPGSQHLLITLDEQKSGKRIGDAEVVVEVTDPHGHMEKKPLLHTHAGGLPDYSELFRFGWNGTYSIHVIVTLHPRARPIDARFSVYHEV